MDRQIKPHPPLGVAQYYGYMQPHHVQPYTDPNLVTHIDSPPVPMPQTFSTEIFSSPSRSQTANLAMSTPSQMQLQPRHLKPYHQDLRTRDCNHKRNVIPRVPSLYARYLLRPPLSHIPHSGAPPLPPLTLWTPYDVYLSPFRHKSPLPSTLSPQHYSGVYPHNLPLSLQQVSPSHSQSSIRPGLH